MGQGAEGEEGPRAVGARKRGEERCGEELGVRRGEAGEAGGEDGSGGLGCTRGGSRRPWAPATDFQPAWPQEAFPGLTSLTAGRGRVTWPRGPGGWTESVTQAAVRARGAGD